MKGKGSWIEKKSLSLRSILLVGTENDRDD